MKEGARLNHWQKIGVFAQRLGTRELAYFIQLNYHSTVKNQIKQIYLMLRHTETQNVGLYVQHNLAVSQDTKTNSTCNNNAVFYFT